MILMKIIVDFLYVILFSFFFALTLEGLHNEIVIIIEIKSSNKNAFYWILF